MYEILIMTALYSLLVAKKRMPVFGQLTLTGDLALDWVKNGTLSSVSKIQIGAAALFDDFNMPEWAKEKGVVALLWPVDEYANPILVTQKSILRVIEAKCCEWEAAGADVSTVKRKLGHVGQVCFTENHPTFEFIRPENAKQYDPYKVVVS
jgi:hypothetical protein|tara:strand:+ start:81 stop:533 length:453 start_codon:yes stop_codon:yes gene_type:complete